MAYKIFSSEYDEIIRPLDIAGEDELAVLAKQFHQMCPVEDLQPLQDRLNQLVVTDQNLAVTLLIDNSGSMRGRPIRFAVGAAGIISTYLDRLGIPNEILGFTSTSWKGGEAREDWLHTGAPKNPGRLCVTRHIIYKSFDEKLDDVRNNLALMLRDGILKENIDGEAVLWASERLREQPANRRILLVISDGAPCCDSTLESNTDKSAKSKKSEAEQKEEDSPPEGEDLPPKKMFNNYLAKHLRSVVADLNAAGDITLDAIGIGWNTEPYYGVGTYIKDLEDLAPTAIAKLEKLLQPPLLLSER